MSQDDLRAVCKYYNNIVMDLAPSRLKMKITREKPLEVGQNPYKRTPKSVYI